MLHQILQVQNIQAQTYPKTIVINSKDVSVGVHCLYPSSPQEPQHATLSQQEPYDKY